jgi:hypothetical protein
MDGPKIDAESRIHAYFLQSHGSETHAGNNVNVSTVGNIEGNNCLVV